MVNSVWMHTKKGKKKRGGGEGKNDNITYTPESFQNHYFELKNNIFEYVLSNFN